MYPVNLPKTGVRACIRLLAPRSARNVLIRAERPSKSGPRGAGAQDNSCDEDDAECQLELEVVREENVGGERRLVEPNGPG